MNTGMRRTVETTRSTVQAGEELNSLAELLQMTIAHLRKSEVDRHALAGASRHRGEPGAARGSDVAYSGGESTLSFETS